VRSITALTVAAGLLLTLGACATSAPSGDCTPTKKPGDASTTITADGSFGKDPKAEFPTPLVTKGVEVSTVSKGDGAVVYPGQYATVELNVFAGQTGESYGGRDFLLRAGESTSKLGYAIECQNVGSRVAVTLTGKDLIGFQTIDETNIDTKATFVIVMDIQSSILGKAHGVPQAPQQGMPSVVTTPDGVPGVTIVGDAPTALKIALLQQGDGAKVSKGDTVYLHYLRVDWDNPDAYKSTWDNFGLAQPVLVAEFDADSQNGLNPGLLKAVLGQKVGSQVLAVVPPKYGFGDGPAPEGVDTSATLVYVIDILGIAKK
jgi:peptidylprolyl isomerase